MDGPIFKGNFTQQEPIPEEAVASAVEVLRSGRLHRYNLTEGEVGETALLEQEYASWQGTRYCLALASGGQALQIALRAAGVATGDPVLTNAFTLAPVPGAIHAVGGRPILVEVDDNLRIDIDDLAAKAVSTSARFLMLSHMRGHLCDMDRVMEVAQAYDLKVIEDCAHTMGASWKGIRSGNFGLAGCFSTQTYKHINSGEGGLLTSDDPDLMARATILSGSYMLYGRHGASPDAEHFDAVRLETANMSARMDHLRAAILRPQLRQLERNVARWNARYDQIAGGLSQSNRILVPERPSQELKVGSSIQFRVPDLSSDACRTLVDSAKARGVELKWFGRDVPDGFTSSHTSWTYVARQNLPRTDAILATLFDMRIPLTFSLEDCAQIADIVREVVDQSG